VEVRRREGDRATAADLLVFAVAVVAEDTVLEDKPAGLPALAVVDPLGQEALEIRGTAVALRLDDAVLVGD